MSNKSLGIDPRIIPLVRTLKEQNIKSSNNAPQDISSEKTSENSTKHNKIIDNKKATESEKNKNEEKEKEISKKQKTSNRFNNKSNTIIKKNINTKISIDGSAENKTKIDLQNRYRGSFSSNKIQIFSKPKEEYQTINSNSVNKFQLTSGQIKEKKYNNMKTRSKYIQNLLNDASIKKYKNSCIDIIKNDNMVKKLYEQCGFEKTNYSYENFIQNNFFNKALFMFKLEILFLDESNFSKKNFKENFFKNEIIKYLNEYNNNKLYQRQMNDLQDVFKEGFESIINFDLFHD
jgi:hypothetical protein